MNIITEAVKDAQEQREKDKNINKHYAQLTGSIAAFGNDRLIKALKDLEQNPDSDNCISKFNTALAVSGARDNNTLKTQALSLLDSLKPPTKTGIGNEGTYKPRGH